jgi:hypothetical protein
VASTLFCVLISACGRAPTPVSTNGSGPSDGEKPTPPPTDPNGNRVCYGSGTCLPLIDRTRITEQRQDYRYPNPQNFSEPSLRKFYVAPRVLIPIRASDVSRSVSENFVVGEFLQEFKGPYGVLTRILVDRIQKIRSRAGAAIEITSGYRSPGYNADLDGSADWSRHMYGDAADFRSDRVSLSRLNDLCRAESADFRLVYTRHIHCDWRLSRDPAFYPALTAKEVVERERIIAGGKIETESLTLPDGRSMVRLKVTGLQIDETDGLLYEWSMTDNNGQQVRSQDEVITLINPSGVYKVSVVVGMNVELTAQFTF